ncbi:MAG: hypothetical protein EBQ92_05105 [Proteobacteria bacterium]|nr:hypothetical protein [Pseudomonadota bacterium]
MLQGYSNRLNKTGWRGPVVTTRLEMADAPIPFTPTQPILQQVAEPYPIWQDKKIILLGIQIILSLVSANTGFVVPDIVPQTLAGLIGGQAIIDLSNGRKIKTVAPMILFVSLALLPSCVVSQPDIQKALNAAGYPYQQTRVRQATLTVEAYKDATASEPDATFEAVCDYGPKTIIPAAPVCEIRKAD